MARAKSPASSAQSSAIIGFEAKLWLAADKFRSNIGAAVLVCLWFVAKSKPDCKRRDVLEVTPTA